MIEPPDAVSADAAHGPHGVDRWEAVEAATPRGTGLLGLRWLLACLIAVLGWVAAPALAQDDHGNSRSSATVIEPNSETAGVLETDDDADVFRLDLEPFRAGAVEAGGLILRTVGETNTVGQLELPSGEIVERELCCGQGRNFLIDQHLDAGTYYLRITGDTGPGDYRLLAAFAADDHPDKAASGTSVTETAEFDAGLQTRHDEDHFRIELSDPHGLVVQTFGDTDTYGTISRLNGEVVETQNWGGQGGNFGMDLHLEAGTYLLKVSGSTSLVHAPYTLLVELVRDDHGGTRETATVMSTFSVPSRLNTRHDKDTFRFDLRQAGQLTVQSLGSLNTCGRLFLPNRRVIAESCISGQWPNFRLREELASGTYFLDVTGGTDTVDAPYTLDVTFDGDRSIPYGGKRHSIPLFVAAANSVQQGFARIINRSDYGGDVSIVAIDDTGWASEPITLSLDALETQHFNADDLELGNASKGLSAGVGSGTGDWRLELETSLDIAALAYTRTPDGLIRSMHDLVPATDLGWTVAFYNPGSNIQRLSVLRLVNPTDDDVTATIQGVDGTGQRSNTVQVEIEAGASRWIESDALESGACCGGAGIGDGAGKWQLAISATGDLQVMSLLRTLEGQLTNLSTNSPTADIVQPTE